jgi:WS/DGAT/MGAT family acyltransferase
MGYTHYERLSALDATFLQLEDENCHMHIGSVALFEAGPLATPAGGIDIDRIRALMEAGMYRIPRYRQRLDWIPVVNHPVWIDDARFNIAYHLRHTNLPRPGDERLLKRLAGRLMSQQLDRTKPLWEMWAVEGVDANRFAIIAKTHHCLIDGVGSVELSGSVMRPTPAGDPDPALGVPRWIPRPAPSPRRLLVEELARRAATPFAAASAIGQAITDPVSAVARLRDTASGLRQAVAAGFHTSSPTPLNTDLGPHRRFDWTQMDLEAIKTVKERVGGTVNDVVLAILSGALRRFLQRRGLSTDDLDFRAMIPVSVRSATERESVGNRVAMVAAALPLDERDPIRRLERVTRATREIKTSRQVQGVKVMEELSDRAFTTLFALFARLAARSQPYNIVVTNVPGPPIPIYLLGARMLACYPLVPLFRKQTLGVALFSYNGTLFWGFNADWDALPDLHDLVEMVTLEYERIRSAAGVAAHHAPGAGADDGASVTSPPATAPTRGGLNDRVT